MKNNHVYDNYEISGCYRLKDDGREFVETCDDAEAQFWTLYGHITGQGVEAIGDFKSRKAAEQVYHRITGQRFTGSNRADARLRLMHAAPDLLTELAGISEIWSNVEGGSEVMDYLESRLHRIRDAIATATATCPPWEADESYSVLLLYPDYANDSGYETYYALVKAAEPIEAIGVARRQAVAAQDGVVFPPDDFHPLLVTQGHHHSEPLFNK